MALKETRGRPQKHLLVVSAVQAQELELIVNQRRQRAWVLRARIVLKSTAGQKDSAVAAALRTNGATVGYRRRRSVSSWNS